MFLDSALHFIFLMVLNLLDKIKHLDIALISKSLTSNFYHE